MEHDNNIFMGLLKDIVQKIVLGSITIEDIRLYIWEKLEPTLVCGTVSTF